jgi:hypothetical protein
MIIVPGMIGFRICPVTTIQWNQFRGALSGSITIVHSHGQASCVPVHLQCVLPVAVALKACLYLSVGRHPQENQSRQCVGEYSKLQCLNEIHLVL